MVSLLYSINPLEKKPRSKHCPPGLYRNNPFMMYKAKVVVCSYIRTKHINAM